MSVFIIHTQASDILNVQNYVTSNPFLQFKPPSYPPGEAPYPQQPVDTVPSLVPPADPGAQPLQPSAPQPG